MDIQKWLEDPKTIQKSKKGYAHFDHRIDIRKAAKFIKEPDNITHYGFYPFIHYTMKMKKYNAKTGKKIKKREICYAAHMDRCIYQYYAAILNEYYNDRIRELGIEKVPVAYRTDLKDSNIQSAKKAFDFIKSQPVCSVMIGDFTNFFDNLDHQYLKKQWSSLLQKDQLPPDHYAVYKNITRYSMWELENLLVLNGLQEEKGKIRKLNSQSVVLSREQYKANRKYIIKNQNPYGIPQGSPISAALANIYMLDADKMIYQKVTEYGGFYMRYSDDFIVILPGQDKDYVFREILDIIKRIPNLTLENRKTQFFNVTIPEIYNVSKSFAEDADNSQRKINFLGFSFDGKKIFVRAKTISKYYYRMNRKATSIAGNEEYRGADKLYRRYSERGAYGKEGNFLTYINRAEQEFGADEMIRNEVKYHMSKIRNSLKKQRTLAIRINGNKIKLN